MKQISFAQAGHQNKKKVTRRERFLAQMEALVPWQRLIDALSPSYIPNAAGKRGTLKNLEGDTLEALLLEIEKTKTSIRAKVEPPFHVIKNLFG
jgi:hypothetical protein